MARRKSKKASNKQLTRATHKGRKARSGSSHHPNSGYGARASHGGGLNADPRLTATAMTRIPSTPHGPEPHLP